MKDILITAIDEICDNKSLVMLDEASIKTSVLLRLLSILGWDIFNINEIRPEYTIESKRVDYSLRINNVNKVFIEVKRPSENLEQHQEQLLNYSFREGVNLSVLTNGITWWFYLPLQEGSWEQRRFYAADFLEQDSGTISDRFIGLLSKSNVVSGTALNNAKELYTSRKKKNISKDTLPKAWDKIITDPDDLLVELLIETSEKLSGFQPEISDVEHFLNNIYKNTQTPIPMPSRSIGTIQTILPKRSTPQPNGYINKTVHSIELAGETFYPRSWKEVLTIVSEKIYNRHASDFNRCLNLKGSKMVYFSLNPNELSQPANISSSKYYVETKLNANSIVKRSLDLIRLFGYNVGDLKVNVK